MPYFFQVGTGRVSEHSGWIGHELSGLILVAGDFRSTGDGEREGWIAGGR